MKALLCKEYGLPETLKVEEVDSLKASPGKVVISVGACSINFPDTLIIRNLYQFKPELPFSPGGEVAGIIKEAGEGVKHLKPGDRVFALCGWGGLSEEVEVDAKRVFPLLPGMDFITGASVMYNYGTSYHALKDRANLQSGETLLVLGAGGGVGLAAVELGKLMGATIIAAASTDEKLKICKEKGADHVINYSTEDIKETIKALTNGKGVDVVYDPVGDKYAEPAIRSMAWKGRYLVVGFAGGEIPKIPLNLALLKGCDIDGVFWGQFAEKEAENNMENIRQLAGYFMQGKLKPHIHKTYQLHEASQAILDLMDRKVVGKAVVVMMDDEVKSHKIQNHQGTQPTLATETVKAEGKLVFKNIAELKTFKGKSLGMSPWQEISRKMIDDFAASTLDFQWIHIDTERVKLESPLGKTIAHGYNVLSFSSHFLYEMFEVKSIKMGLNYGCNKVRFMSATPVGSRVRMSAILVDVEETAPNQAKLTIEATFNIKGQEKPVCVAEILSMIFE
ncbi:MAG: zinc-binding dehydrogenase [Saprospiraceae bacterium]|nr:zinc-binding dehydrogenase [Saprospiraceae bacterium]